MKIEGVILHDPRAPEGRRWGFAVKGNTHSYSGFETREEAVLVGQCAGLVFESEVPGRPVYEKKIA